jgi:microcystin-dependent protein
MPGTTPTLGLPYPTPDDQVDVPRDVKALADSLDPLGTVPVGAFMMWLTAITPVNWLFMNGQQVDAGLYPKLAALLGQVAGKVTIPDMRDVFPAGAGPTMALGATGGAAAVALTEAQLGSHVHYLDAMTWDIDRSLDHQHLAAGNTGYYMTYLTGSGISGYSGGGEARPASDRTGNALQGMNHQHRLAANTDSRGGNQTHENRPPFRAINFIIRAG